MLETLPDNAKDRSEKSLFHQEMCKQIFMGLYSVSWVGLNNADLDTKFARLTLFCRVHVLSGQVHIVYLYIFDIFVKFNYCIYCLDIFKL